MSSTIFASCLTDLQHIYHVEQQTMFLLSIIQNIGCIIGSLIGLFYGFCEGDNDWISGGRQLTIMVFSFVLSLSTAFTPLYNPLFLTYFMLMIQGLSIGVFTSSYQMWFIEMWPKHIATILHVNQFVYGVGMIITSVISSDYVSGDNDNNNSQIIIIKSNVVDNDRHLRIQHILVPYIITGIVQALGK